MVHSTAEEKGEKPQKRKLCEHGNQKYRCKKCGGAGICAHGKSKQFCEECDDSGLWEHGKQKLFLRIVAVVPFVSMARINIDVKIVTVEICARPHIVQPAKFLSMKDTFFLLCTFVSYRARGKGLQDKGDHCGNFSSRKVS